MSASIRQIDYFAVTVPDRPGEACRFLSALAEAGVALVAFAANPTGPGGPEELLVFPEGDEGLAIVAEEAGYQLHGPRTAILVQGENHVGALVDIHRRLGEAGINVVSATGVTDGRGGFGYIIFLRPEDLRSATRALQI
jgi:hypothetical protein